MELEENPEYNKQMKAIEKTKIDFLKTYYGYKNPNEVNVSKICRIRELFAYEINNNEIYS